MKSVSQLQLRDISYKNWVINAFFIQIDQQRNQFIYLQLTDDERTHFQQVNCHLHAKFGVQKFCYTAPIKLRTCAVFWNTMAHLLDVVLLESGVLLECSCSVKALVVLLPQSGARFFLLLFLQQQQSSNDSYQQTVSTKRAVELIFSMR